MKKILTFLMMFAMTAGILSAQIPTLSYQVVVRDDQNNLVVDQDVVASVVILAPEAVYSEDIPGHTNHNGMLSLTIGLPQELELEEGQEPANADFPVNPVNPFASIDWSNAQIQVSIMAEGNKIMSYTEDVFAVPYAMQASFLLTTDLIVDYLTRPSADGEGFETTGADVDTVYQVLMANILVQKAILDSVVNYIKNNYGIAKQIAHYYMHQVTGDDVREAYDHINAVDAKVKNALVEVVKDYITNHRALVKDLAKYYIETTNATELNQLANDLHNSPVYPFIQVRIDTILDAYMRAHGLDPKCLSDYNYTLCDLQAALQNASTNANDTCPTITSVMNTANDGLVALATNQGIIMTAYVKNKQENAQYGFLLSESQIEAYADSLKQTPVYYYPISGNGKFGKIVDTMNNSALCGKTLYARAYLNQTKCSSNVPTLLSNQMGFTVPTFTINNPDANNTVSFSPAEAQTVFNADNRLQNNVWWYTSYNEETHTGDVAHQGATYTEATPGTTYTVVARLGQCYVTKSVTIPSNN